MTDPADLGTETVCRHSSHPYFLGAHKFKSRYATFGFDDAASLDDDTMWPTSFALTKLTADDEARISALVKKAVSRGAPHVRQRTGQRAASSTPGSSQL